MLAALPDRNTDGPTPGARHRGQEWLCTHVGSLMPGRLAPRLLITHDCSRGTGRLAGSYQSQAAGEAIQSLTNAA